MFEQSPKCFQRSLCHLYPKEKGLTWAFHCTDNGGKAHEVKWFVLYHNLAAIKQDKSAPVRVPRGKGNQVRPMGNQARGLNETPCPRLSSFRYFLRICFPQDSTQTGGSWYRRLRKKRGFRRARVMGIRKRLPPPWAWDPWGVMWEDSGSVQREDRKWPWELWKGLWRGQSCLKDSKTRGTEKHLTNKLIWSWLILVRQLENSGQISWTILKC